MGVLTLLLYLLPQALALTRSYLDTNCTGVIRTTFRDEDIHANVCLRGLFTRSVYSDEPIRPPYPLKAITAFRPSAVSSCGTEMCQIMMNTPGFCCSVNQLKIRAIMLFQLQQLAGERITSEQQLLQDTPVSCEGGKTADMWEAGSVLGVDVGNGTYIDVPNTTKKPPTKQEVISALNHGGIAKPVAEKLASRVEKELSERHRENFHGSEGGEEL